MYTTPLLDKNHFLYKYENKSSLVREKMRNPEVSRASAVRGTGVAELSVADHNSLLSKLRVSVPTLKLVKPPGPLRRKMSVKDDVLYRSFKVAPRVLSILLRSRNLFRFASAICTLSEEMFMKSMKLGVILNSRF